VKVKLSIHHQLIDNCNHHRYRVFANACVVSQLEDGCIWLYVVKLRAKCNLHRNESQVLNRRNKEPPKAYDSAFLLDHGAVVDVSDLVDHKDHAVEKEEIHQVKAEHVRDLHRCHQSIT
jgi:hypothetical protein